MKHSIDYVKLFATSGLLIQNDLDVIAEKFSLDLGHNLAKNQDHDETYYPQFREATRNEAKKMAQHYELFYCLETAIRELISETLIAECGEAWWSADNVPKGVLESVERSMRKELDSGVTPRSTDHIDYSNFGELGEIIKINWDVFGSIFNSKKAVETIMSRLNTLRGPIAHCSPLAEDEVLRLRLTVKDWFRLME